MAWYNAQELWVTELGLRACIGKMGINMSRTQENRRAGEGQRQRNRPSTRPFTQWRRVGYCAGQ
eukprot:2070011-Amphidinium_carterae.1